MQKLQHRTVFNSVTAFSTIAVPGEGISAPARVMSTLQSLFELRKYLNNCWNKEDRIKV